jgi:hypothetical protein
MAHRHRRVDRHDSDGGDLLFVVVTGKRGIMSIKVMTDVWAHADCSGSELLVLLALADFCDDDGQNIYPSMPTLAKKARLSVKQARRVVQNLVKLDLVEIVEAGGWDRGRNRSNSYRIKLETLRAKGTPKLGVPHSHPREDGTPAGDRTVLPPTGDDPSLEPLTKPPLKKRATRTPKTEKRYSDFTTHPTYIDPK